MLELYSKYLHLCRNHNRGSLHLNQKYAPEPHQNLPLPKMLMKAKCVNIIITVTSRGMTSRGMTSLHDCIHTSR